MGFGFCVFPPPSPKPSLKKAETPTPSVKWNDPTGQQNKTEHTGLLDLSLQSPVSTTAFTITQNLAPTSYIILEEHAFIYICAIPHEQKHLDFFFSFYFTLSMYFGAWGFQHLQ